MKKEFMILKERKEGQMVVFGCKEREECCIYIRLQKLNLKNLNMSECPLYVSFIHILLTNNSSSQKYVCIYISNTLFKLTIHSRLIGH